jgi:death-on-curing family protein
MSEIVIYKTPDEQTAIEVQFEGETVWLTQSQITELFQRDRTVITKHINNIFKEGELEEKSNVQKMHIANSDKPVVFYNLDIIISVGYRVKSQRGTQFRQWATQRLKDYLAKGYAINQKRLDELGRMVQLIEQSGKTETLQLQEAKGLLEILGYYTKSFVLLNQYDRHNLQAGRLSKNITYEIEYDEAISAVTELRKQLIAKKEATKLFGNEKDESFKSSLRSIVQTFGGQYLYPSIEEQAAHLLYFVIKNHSFSDGNKRIGAFLFIWFLEKNKHRFKSSGELKINDNGLTAIALLVAQSKPEEKEIIVQLIVALIADSK